MDNSTSYILKTILYLCLLVLSLTGCGENLLEKYIDEKWPPVSLEDHRKEALANLASNLTSIQYPTIAFGLDLEFASQLLYSDELKEKGITNLNLTSSNQFVETLAEFDTPIGPLSNDDTLKRLNPIIKGKVKLFFGVTSAYNEQANKVNIKLLPNLHEISIDSITIEGDYEVPVVGDLIVNFLNKYADNISGELSRQEVMFIEIPSSYTDEIRLSETLKKPSFGKGTSVTISDQPIKPPYKLTNIITLAHNNQLIGMIELYDENLYEIEDKIFDSPTQDDTFETLFGKYQKIESIVFTGRDNSNTTWLGVRKDLIAHLLSNTLNQAQLCTSITAEKRVKSSEKIELPDGAGIDCSPNRDCTPTRNCSFVANKDTRSCNRCLVSNLFGGCIVRGNDPFCEAAKASQNAIYQADAAGKKIDCERLKTQKKITCEAEKSAEKILCESKKAIIDVIGRTGNFANIDTNTLIGGNANLCLTNSTFNSTLDTLNSVIRVSGKVRVDVGFKFVPLDIVGHLTCPFPWTEDYNVTATIKEQSIPIDAKIEISVENGSGKYTYKVASLSLEVGLNPTPAELLIEILESTNMNMACTVTMLLKS